MRTLTILRCCLVAALSLLPVSLARSAEPGEALVGGWTTEHEGMTEVWTIKVDGGTWSVSYTYSEGDKVVGGGKGKNVKLAGEKLTLVQSFDKKPRAGWKDNALYTASRDGDKLSLQWRVAKSSGSRVLTRVDAESEPAKPVAKPKDPAPKDPSVTKPKDPPAKVVIPPAAKPGETVRFVIVPVGLNILSIDDVKGGKLKDINPVGPPGGEAKIAELGLKLKEIKSQPEGLKFEKGLYFTYSTFCKKDGKSAVGPTIHAEKPIPECDLIDWKYLGEGVGSYFLISVTSTDAKIYFFEAKVKK